MMAGSGTGAGSAGGNVVPAAMRHGATAGTGGSEEWPSTQTRVPQVLREPDYDAEKTSAQAGLPRRKAGRQPGNLSGVPETPTRRSPEVPDPRQQAAAQEAWRGEAGLDLHGAALGGLPSIHGGFLSGPQGSGLGGESSSSSRVPSRLTASTPTPREEDTLDLVARQLHHGNHGFSGGSRWSSSAAAADWPGLGPGAGAPSVALGPAELAPVRDPRGPHHDARAPQQDVRGTIAGLGRRPDFGNVYQAY